jgi:hypothetical protein
MTNDEFFTPVLHYSVTFHPVTLLPCHPVTLLPCYPLTLLPLKKALPTAARINNPAR